MIGRLKRLLRPAAPPPQGAVFDAPLAPETPLYAVGDIHGRADLLHRLLDQLDTDMSAHGLTAAQVVFLGDYIDRGEQSAEVLAIMHRLAREHGPQVTCLMGNHERMLLDFLEAPAEKGARWLRNGGLQTLASYGVGGIAEHSGPDEMAAAAYALSAALPEGVEAWLRGLPLAWQSGNLVCVHAALDPGEPLARQTEHTLIWGHPRFLTEPRTDGRWIAHGHTVVDTPVAEEGRISIDTGAYFSGRLTAAAVFPEEEVRFLHG